MAKNFIQPGKVLDYVAPGGGVVSGVPVLIGDQLVIPLITAAAGAAFAGQVEGVWSIDKPAGVFAIGVTLYWDNGAGKVTTTSVGNRKCGTVARAAGNADTTVWCRLDGIGTEAATEAAAGAAVAAAVATSNVGAGDAGKLVKLDAAGKVAGRVLETDGAKLDAAVATSNVGAGDAGKLVKLDAAGKIAGRVLETDGAKLDSVKACTVAIAAGSDNGTLAAPVGWANGDKCIGTLAGLPTNAVGVKHAEVAGGFVTVTLGGLNGLLNGQPGGAGVNATVVRVQGL
jgi:predicted RecA/RadA family phage recombinase